MADSNTNGNATLPATATEQPVNNPEPQQPVAPQNAEKPVATSDDELLFNEKVTNTLRAVRGERDEAILAQRTLEGRLQQLEQQARERDEREAIASGNFKELYEKKAQELTEANSTKAVLETNFDTYKAEAKRKEQSLTDSTNRMIDANIAKWPEKARNLVKSAENVSVEERLAQFITANDFVQDFMNEAPNPGLPSSPQDIRENGRERKVDIRDKVESQKASGIYRV